MGNMAARIRTNGNYTSREPAIYGFSTKMKLQRIIKGLNEKDANNYISELLINYKVLLQDLENEYNKMENKLEKKYAYVFCTFDFDLAESIMSRIDTFSPEEIIFIIQREIDCISLRLERLRQRKTQNDPLYRERARLEKIIDSPDVNKYFKARKAKFADLTDYKKAQKTAATLEGKRRVRKNPNVHGYC